MEALVSSAKTKAEDNILLNSKAFETPENERVVVLLHVEAETAVAKTLQKEAHAIVQHSMVEGEGEPAQRLDSTLKELNGLIKGLLLSKTITDVHAIIALITDDHVLHVSHAGRAEAYIVRGGTASQITEYTKGKPSPAFVHIASGNVEPKDTIILSSQRLLRTITPAQLAQISQNTSTALEEIKSAMETEEEVAALTSVYMKSAYDNADVAVEQAKPAPSKSKSAPKARLQRASIFGVLENSGSWLHKVRTFFDGFLQDLRDPKRKKKAHLLLTAGIVAVFLLIWASVNITTIGQQSKTKADLEELVTKINEDLRSAENRRLTGDVEMANNILERAEELTVQLSENESGLFRNEALELGERIRSKREEINNIIRLSPRILTNLAAKNPDIQSVGFIGLPDEEFIVFDKRDLFRVLHNNVDDPDRLTDEHSITFGKQFERYQTYLFQITGNSILELINGQVTSMKTEDPAGWITGKDVETYLRFLYVLSPENNQIYKYERLSNRYASPDQYNVNGELADALDMAIDGNIFIIKDDGTITKLLRGEVQPFSIRNAPDNILDDANRIYKVADGNLYLLDPVHSRVIILSGGGASGESSYIKQYVLEGETVGELRDLYIDPEETRLYVLDEKHIYAIDLAAN